MVSLVSNWRVPRLSREGQEAFWNQQASDYSSVDMAHNTVESALARALIEEYPEDSAIEDIVSLGCADGMRDPHIILSWLKTPPKRVYYNDVSGDMVKKAGQNLPLEHKGKDIDFVPVLGPVCEITGLQIPSMPRRIILGVYRVEALSEAYPHYGQTRTGFRQYMEHRDRLGPRFQFTAIHLDGFNERVTASMLFSFHDREEHINYMEEILEGSVRSPNQPHMIRVVSWRDDSDPAFFISHWYSERGIRKIIERHMGKEQAERMSILPCAKGYMICIDPIEKPRGVVTVLNNVLGNILPEELGASLKAIDQMAR